MIINSGSAFVSFDFKRLSQWQAINDSLLNLALAAHTEALNSSDFNGILPFTEIRARSGSENENLFWNQTLHKWTVPNPQMRAAVSAIDLMFTSANIFDLTKKLLIGLFVLLLNVFMFIGNAMVILVIAKYRKLRTTRNYMILSLAFADLLLSITVLPFSGINLLLKRWIFAQSYCKIYVSLDFLLCTASILNLCLIAVEQYIEVTKPWITQTYSKNIRIATYLSILLVWIVSIVISWGVIHIVDNLQAIPAAGSGIVTSTDLKTTTYKRDLLSQHSGAVWHNSDLRNPLGRSSWQSNEIQSASLSNDIINITWKHIPTQYLTVEWSFDKVKTLNNILLDRLPRSGNSVGPGGIGATASDVNGSTEECSYLSHISPGFALWTTVLTFILPMIAILFAYYHIFAIVRERAIRTKQNMVRFNKAMTSKPTDIGHVKNSVRTRKALIDEKIINEIGDPESSSVISVINGHSIRKGANGSSKHYPNNIATNDLDEIVEVDDSEVQGGGNKALAQIVSQVMPSKSTNTSKQPTVTTNTADYSPGITKDRSGATGSSSDHIGTLANNTFSSATNLTGGVEQNEINNKSVKVNGEAVKPHYFSRMANTILKKGSDIYGKNSSTTSSLKSRHLDKKAKLDSMRRKKALLKEARHSNKERKAIKMLGIIISSFTICWVPYFTMYVADPYCNHCMPIPLFTFVTWLGYVNSCLNPVIYAVYNTQFRTAFKDIAILTADCIRKYLFCGALIKGKSSTQRDVLKGRKLEGRETGLKCPSISRTLRFFFTQFRVGGKGNGGIISSRAKQNVVTRSDSIEALGKRLQCHTEHVKTNPCIAEVESPILKTLSSQTLATTSEALVFSNKEVLTPDAKTFLITTSSAIKWPLPVIIEKPVNNISHDLNTQVVVKPFVLADNKPCRKEVNNAEPVIELKPEEIWIPLTKATLPHNIKVKCTHNYKTYNI